MNETKTRIPIKPKKPLSAYFLWVNENREKLKEEFPGISILELCKKSVERFKELSDKTRWEKLAAEAKAEYAAAMEEYNKNKVSDSEDSEDDCKAAKKGKAESKFKPKEKISTFGSGAENFKSQEMISNRSDLSSDDSDKPLKKKVKNEKEARASEEKEEQQLDKESTASGSDSEKAAS